MSSGASKSIGILIAVIVLAGALLANILPSLAKQKPSDCKSNQVYNSSTERCRDKTSEEIEAEKQAEEARKKKLEDEARVGKQNGSICLTAKESWNNIGKSTCVVFYPEYFYRTGYGYLFIDEKKDYKNGFVAFFAYRNMLSWEEFTARYSERGEIVVSGTIEWYEGHPEIIVRDLSQISAPKLVNCETSYGCIYSRGEQL